MCIFLDNPRWFAPALRQKFESIRKISPVSSVIRSAEKRPFSTFSNGLVSHKETAMTHPNALNGIGKPLNGADGIFEDTASTQLQTFPPGDNLLLYQETTQRRACGEGEENVLPVLLAKM